MEAIDSILIIKEILAECGKFALGGFSLRQTKADESYATGFSVFVRPFLGTVFKLEVQDIAKKFGFAIRNEDDGIIVYKPKQL
jgi:hypothetical protein